MSSIKWLILFNPTHKPNIFINFNVNKKGSVVLFYYYRGRALLIFNYSVYLNENQQYRDIISLASDGNKNNHFEIIAFKCNVIKKLRVRILIKT